MEFDCRSCGACCVGLDVLLGEEEAGRFESRPELLRLTRRHRMHSGLALRFMRKDARTGRCAALAGPRHDCRCTIYGQRPALCRQLEPDSPHCREARYSVFGMGGSTPSERSPRRTASA